MDENRLSTETRTTHFGAHLGRLRKEAGLTLDVLRQRLGWSLSRLHRVEHAPNPRVSTWIDVCRALGRHPWDEMRKAAEWSA